MTEATMQRGKRLSIEQGIQRLLGSCSGVISSELLRGTSRKRMEVEASFGELPHASGVDDILRRWAALDMLLKGNDRSNEKPISQAQYDREVEAVLKFLMEKAARQAHIEHLIGEVRDIPTDAIRRKKSLIIDLFFDTSPPNNFPVLRGAEKWVAIDILLKKGKITQEEYEEMHDHIIREIKKKASQRGINPSSSNASYGQMSSGLLASRRRTT